MSSHPLFAGGETFTAADFDWLLSVLLRRVRTQIGSVTRHEPGSDLLQIGRLLTLLVRAGHLDPFYLLARLRDESVLEQMSEMLEHQCDAMAYISLSPEEQAREAARLSRAVEILKRGRTLEALLCKGGSIDQSTQDVTVIVEQGPPAEPSCSAPGYLAALQNYYRILIPLLRARSLEDIVKLKEGWAPVPIEVGPFASYHLLERIIPDLLARAEHYWLQKHADLYLDPPLSTLQHEDFYGLLTSWRSLQGAIDEQQGCFSQQERLLLDRLIQEWGRVIDEEQTKSLLQDFFEVIDQKLRDRPPVPLNAVAGMSWVREEESLTVTALTNFFTRLLLFSEPQCAFFFYLKQDRQRRVDGRVFRLSGGVATLTEDAAEVPTSQEGGLWSQAERVERLKPEEILRWLAETEPGCDWRVIPIPNAAETSLSFGFYLFGWKPGALGLERFDLHRLTWTPLLQALAFRQAFFEQQTITSRLFSMVAHNLGSPVFKMHSDLAVLAKGFLDNLPEQRQQKYFELQRQARHMRGIIDGILSLSQRTMAVDITTVSLARLLHDVVRTVRRDAHGKGISIEVARPLAPGEDRSYCLTDEVKVYDILLNFLTNAVKYSPPGSRIQAELHPGRRGFKIQVRDEGPGILKDEMPMLFQPFFRGRRAETIPGLGLGLYISQLYALSLGGRVQAENNRDGGGATFSLFLHDYNAHSAHKES